jgi:hypothetical protein
VEFQAGGDWHIEAAQFLGGSDSIFWDMHSDRTSVGGVARSISGTVHRRRA